MEIIDIIKKSVNTTLKKYPTDEEKFINSALTKIFNSNNYDLFTTENNIRQNMQILGKDVLAIELIHGALVSKQIQEQLGKIKNLDSEKQKFPVTIEQAQNYIYQKIEQTESPSIVYVEVKCIDRLRELLIASYANLIATSTEEQLKIANQFLSYRFADKLETLDNLQNYLIRENKKRIFGSSQDDTILRRRY